MEFRNLLSFLRVAELGNFTKAANELGYAQSTVTTQIQQLEDELGVPLFERIGTKNMLTSHGQQLVVYANRILQNVEEIRKFGSTDPNDVKVTLRIGIVESLLCSVLLSIISAYRKEYPNVSILIRQGVTADLLTLLRRNEVDMVFTFGEHWDTKDCECAASHQENAVFFASQTNPLTSKQSISLNEVLRQPLILTGEKTYLHQELTRMAFHCGAEIAPCIQTDSAKVIVDMVDQNLGISLLPEYMVRHSPFSKNYHLRVLPVEDFSMTFYTCVFYHKNKWLTSQMIGLINMVEDYWKHFDTSQPVETLCLDTPYHVPGKT